MTPKLHPLEPRTQAPGGRVNPASPLPVSTTPASGWGRPALAPPLLGPPGREAGQVPRALPYALKSKTITTPGELRQVGLRLSSATPSLGRGAYGPRRTPAALVAATAWECKARGFVRRDRAGRPGSPGLSETPCRTDLRATHQAHFAAPGYPCLSVLS